MCSIQHSEPRRIELDARARQLLLEAAVLCDAPPERRARQAARRHQLQRAPAHACIIKSPLSGRASTRSSACSVWSRNIFPCFSH